MHKRIIDLARDPTFIPHVYDYCDMWCLACPITSRCLVFSAGLAGDGAQAATGEWDLDEEIQHGIAFARVVADTTRSPVADLDVRLADPSTAPRAPALGDPLELLARHYAVQAGRFLLGQGVDIGERPGGPYGEPLVVVAWYHVMIAAKTYRALASAHLSAEQPTLRDDALASGKVVLIGIDRSIAAWRRLEAESDDGRVGGLLELLEALRFGVEQRFPAARAFMRPGLDQPCAGAAGDRRACEETPAAVRGQ